jgi:hypothetical protein
LGLTFATIRIVLTVTRTPGLSGVPADLPTEPRDDRVDA